MVDLKKADYLLINKKIKKCIVMIKIKEIEIPTPKWWQVGLIILVIVIAIIVIKENPEQGQKILENIVEKIP